MLEAEAVDGLHAALVEVASNPARIEGLHHILGDFCHLFRNKLNCLKLSLYLSKQGGCAGDVGIWGELEREYRASEEFLEIVQLIYRPMPLDLVRLDLGLLIDDRWRAWQWRSNEPRLDVRLFPPERPTVISFDPCRLAKAFDALFAWRSAVAYPSVSARLRWRAQGDQVHVEWADDGPYGLDDEALATGRSELLALPLLIRVVSAHGGSLTITREDGIVLTMRWPLDAQPQ